MKKILTLFAMLLVAASAWSLPFVPTTDPSASTTKWYHIKTGSVYLYNEMSWGEIFPSTTASTDDHYLWCFVGTESTGYTIYNRGAQAYMSGLSVNGRPGDGGLSYVEMASGNNFYIWHLNQYINPPQKMYLTYISETNSFTNESGKFNTYTAVEVEVEPTPPPVDTPYETLTATDYHVPHNALSNTGDEGYKKLIDRDRTTKWRVVNNSGSWETIWLDIESDVWFIPNAYVLTTGKDTQTNPNRNPKEWVLYGKVFKNDEWTELAHVTNGGGLEAKNTKDYTFALMGITQGYRYYRFEVRQINGKDSDNNYTFQLAELQFTGTAVADPTPSGLPFVPTTNPSASSTHWYQIKTTGTYLYYDPSSYFLGIASSPSTDDNYQWCFVGTASTGYKVYNRANQCYLRHGFLVDGQGNESDINYVEVESGNSFAIYFNNQGGKYYLGFSNGEVNASNHKTTSFTAVQVGTPTPPPTVPGDLNGDGQVDIADVNTVINMMLGKTSPTAAGDVTGDNSVDIADVNAVINLMLGKTTPTPPPTNPTAQSLTAIGYNVPHNSVSNTGDEGYAKLVDGNRNTKWCVANPTGAWETIWIDLKSNVAFKPTSYILTTGNDTQIYYRRNPKNWKIYGRNSDSETWTELVHVTDGGGLAATNTTDYSFQFNGITKAYQYYRFEVLEVVGADQFESNYYAFQLAELTLMGIGNR